jgi:hypothetical protein
VKDNTALFRERRVEVGQDGTSEFSEYLDDLDFFDAVQIIGADE